jgi:hypothetical protein
MAVSNCLLILDFGENEVLNDNDHRRGPQTIRTFPQS